ncbi:rho GTPase-activating protein 36 isoform X3 [Heterocephalus glaber]|uniref:Rho GTPase-activating protein 36 isoform X3 n=1 Tax=Heterocephalus glaber TaxID=10181 RepID=A0AAX6PU27_HETGA|nr:rho GTPase-activating protein 36 isoform X3 [Heterocephalus glaber]
MYPRIMAPLLLLSAFIFLVSILGGAPGHGPDPQMKVVSIHSLSELERLKLQETAYQELRAKHFLSGFKPNRAVTTDRPNTLENSFLVLRGQDGALSSLQTFGVRLEEVLVNEFTRRKHLELTAAMQVEEANREAIGGGPRRRRNIMQRMLGRVRLFFNRPRNEPALPREFTRRGRRGAMSVDSLAELEDGSLLLEALQLSRASFPMGERLWGSKTEMSLNPIAKQIPQVVETCCRFIEEHGLSAVGIFTMERSAEKVRQLREEFDQGLDVVLDENQNVYDVAVVLKEFFRDMQDSLLPDDLRKSFLLTATLKPQDQLAALQLLVYLLPPCHSDSLERLLKVLHKITEYSEDSIDLDGQVVPGNRMTSTNLALVFGSVLLKEEKPVKRESRKTQLRTDHYVASVNVVHAMIDNWDVLFQVPPHIQRQVAKRVWNSSPEALDFIRRRNLRKIQSARIKMEEDALVSDPVDSPAEARAAVLGQSRPFDEDPKGVPDVQETLDAGENLNYDFEEGPNYEDQQNVNLAEVPYLDVIPNNEDSSDTEEISGSFEDPVVLPGAVQSYDDEEGSGNLPIPEQKSPIFRVPRKKKAKTGIRYFFP